VSGLLLLIFLSSAASSLLMASFAFMRFFSCSSGRSLARAHGLALRRGQGAGLELKLKRVHSLGPWSLAMTLKSERIARLIEQRSSPRELAPLRDLVDTMVLRLRTTFWRSPVGIPSRLKPETLFLGVSAFWLANCDDLANLRKVNGRHSEAVPAVFSGAPQLRAPKWYLALTTHLLPERLRGEFGLVFGEREQRSMNLALALIRRLYPRLPMRIRAVGPYQEALARLQGERQPDLAVRWLNRLWIGRRMME
jgi:hypothetical protein